MGTVTPLRRIPRLDYLLQHKDGIIGAIKSLNVQFPHLVERLLSISGNMYYYYAPPELHNLLARTDEDADNEARMYLIHRGMDLKLQKISSLEFFIICGFIQSKLGNHQAALESFFDAEWLFHRGVEHMISKQELEFSETENAMRFHVAFAERDTSIAVRTVQTIREIVADMEMR